MTFGYVFDHDIWQKLQNPHRRSSLSDDNMNSVHNPLLGNVPWKASPKVNAPEHRLNSKTLDFLKNKSELVATVTSIIADISCDSVASDLQEEHYAAKTLQEEPQVEGSITSGTAKQHKAIGHYAYHKLLQDYPILQQYLMLDRAPLVRVCHTRFGATDDPLQELCHMTATCELRTALLSSTTGPHYQHILLSVISELIDSHKWAVAIHLMNKVPWTSFLECQKWSDVRDYVLCCAVNSSPFVASPSQEDVAYVPSLVAQVEDLSLRRRLVLANLKHWVVKDAIVLLKLCCRFGDADELTDELAMAVHARLHQMQVYQQVRKEYIIIIISVHL